MKLRIIDEVISMPKELENILEQTFDASKAAKLRKRIHLPKELAKEVHEERFIVDSIHEFQRSYNKATGWMPCWMQPKFAIIQAREKEVILRRHPVLGNFIIYRVWRANNA